MAENSSRAVEAQAENARLADCEAAQRLAAVNRSAIAVGDAVDRVIGRQNMDHLLSVVPMATKRVAYGRMESAAMVERSMQSRLAYVQQRLADCRHRVANKSALLGRLNTLTEKVLSSMNASRPEVGVGSSAAVAVVPLLPSVDKSVDQLKLSLRQQTKVGNAITENMAMLSVLRVQLAADVRQQAATVAELNTYRTSAHRDAAAFNLKYCRVVNKHATETRQNETTKRELDSKIEVLEANRSAARSLMILVRKLITYPVFCPMDV